MSSNGPKCRTCGKPIMGCAETKYGGGWVHLRTNAERCAPPHRAFAAPVTLDHATGLPPSHPPHSSRDALT